MKHKALRSIKYLAFIALAGCNAANHETTLDSASVGAPRKFMSALDAIPQPQDNVTLFDLNMNPISDPTTLNQILVCGADGICWSDCVSVYYPQVERYSVFKTDYLDNDKCVAYALQYPDGINIPKMSYWLGTYDLSDIHNPKCSFDPSTPNFEGRAYFGEVRVPQGQSPVHGRMLYFTQNWFDLNDNPDQSVYLYEFNPPASWAYLDTTVNRAWITPQLVSNEACVARSQIR